MANSCRLSINIWSTVTPHWPLFLSRFGFEYGRKNNKSESIELFPCFSITEQRLKRNKNAHEMGRSFNLTSLKEWDRSTTVWYDIHRSCREKRQPVYTFRQRHSRKQTIMTHHRYYTLRTNRSTIRAWCKLVSPHLIFQIHVAFHKDVCTAVFGFIGTFLWRKDGMHLMKH